MLMMDIAQVIRSKNALWAGGLSRADGGADLGADLISCFVQRPISRR